MSQVALHRTVNNTSLGAVVGAVAIIALVFDLARTAAVQGLTAADEKTGR